VPALAPESPSRTKLTQFRSSTTVEATRRNTIMCSPAGIGVGLLTHTSKPAHSARRSSHHCFAACSVNLPRCSGSPPPPRCPACREYAPSPRMSSAFGAAALLSPAVLWPPAGFSPFAEDEHLPHDFLQDTCTEELQENRPRHGQGNCKAGSVGREIFARYATHCRPCCGRTLLPLPS
jgi:hypothetical protein